MKKHGVQDLPKAFAAAEHGPLNPFYEEGISSPSKSITQALLESRLEAQLTVLAIME